MVSYALCYPTFSPEDGRLVEQFRRTFEPDRARLVGAHVTLVFGTGLVAPPELSRLVRRAIGTIPRFSTTLARVATDEDPISGSFKLYLVPSDGQAQFRSMYRRLHAGRLARDVRPNTPFAPHITIATSRIEADIAQARVEARALPLPMAATIDSVVIASLRDHILSEVDTIPLA
ncbi:MAG: 2'-5' RNA ligase family protein [Pseudomonadota bacterium]